ncbi:hypothetical protein P618_200096 [Holospora obtusa F1]|uniref:Uncharacterized protein n=1 Tax=Holospora obtusa F1 TaxID=1399147 RepID=W6TEJ3_HOLOB|nr:hypothetical protein [Holospora obtusa]ETZ07708.1 hypothetical protein P618_200096 [Holospora obtusa F1]
MLYQLNIKKIENSGLLLSALSQKIKKRCPHYQKRKEMQAAIVGKILPQFIKKQLISDDQKFI